VFDYIPFPVMKIIVVNVYVRHVDDIIYFALFLSPYGDVLWSPLTYCAAGSPNKHFETTSAV